MMAILRPVKPNCGQQAPFFRSRHRKEMGKSGKSLNPIGWDTCLIFRKMLNSQYYFFFVFASTFGNSSNDRRTIPSLYLGFKCLLVNFSLGTAGPSNMCRLSHHGAQVFERPLLWYMKVVWVEDRLWNLRDMMGTN